MVFLRCPYLGLATFEYRSDSNRRAVRPTDTEVIPAEKWVRETRLSAAIKK